MFGPRAKWGPIDKAWKAECVDCRYARFFPYYGNAVWAAGKHSSKHSGHRVDVIDMSTLEVSHGERQYNESGYQYRINLGLPDDPPF